MGCIFLSILQYEILTLIKVEVTDPGLKKVGDPRIRRIEKYNFRLTFFVQ